MGDSYHAIAPITVNTGTGNEPVTVYAKGSACGDQIAFKEEDGFVLLAAEFTGGCARVVNLQSGQIVANLPETAPQALWANRPAS